MSFATSLRTMFLFGVLTVLFVLVGFALGGTFAGDPLSGMVAFLVLAAVFNFVMYFFSAKMVLSAYRAKVIGRDQNPRLYGLVERVALKADVPMPKVAIIPSRTPNAFATGRNPKHAVVAATVAAKVVTSTSRFVTWPISWASTPSSSSSSSRSRMPSVAAAIAFASRMAFWSSLFGGGRRDGNPAVILIVMLTAPIAAMLIQLGISRQREYKADHRGAVISGKPWALARALEKMEKGVASRPMQGGNPAHASLFIVNPFRGRSMTSLFSTHPPTAKRVERLRRMV
jgi:heat shock protein HtpX